MPGSLIALEGIDGSGKTTQALRVFRHLVDQRFDAEIGVEPDTRAPIGKAIRSMLDGVISKPDDPINFQRMYVVDRAQHLFASIIPSLRSGYVYVSDRYAMSTFAYGMAATGYEPLVFAKLHESIVGSQMYWPDLNIVIDVPVSVALERLTERHAERDAFEKKDFLNKVRMNYLALVEWMPFSKKSVVINGTVTEDEVFERIMYTMESVILKT